MILHLQRYGRISATLLQKLPGSSLHRRQKKTSVEALIQSFKCRVIHTCTNNERPFSVSRPFHVKFKFKTLTSSLCQQSRVYASGDVKDEHVPTPPKIENNTITQKIVDACPTRLQPFLRLSRVHQPIGTWLLFWPCTWGLGLASGGIPDVQLLLLFGAGAFIMRGAGCTVNDMWDRHIDKQVTRTLNRPLASGELRMRHAAVWLLFQLSLAFSILLQLNYPCFIIGVGSLGLVTVYPLAKRVTNWPQAVLGTTFNIGILMGFTAAAKYGQLGYLSFPWLDPSCLSLYLAGISWTLIYDTIYAHQDWNDDKILGLGSTAQRFGENTKAWLTGFSGVTTASLMACGVLENLQWPYYLSVAGVAMHLAWQIHTLDIHNHQNCSERFKSNRHIGWIIFLGIIGSNVLCKGTSESAKNSQELKPITSSPQIMPENHKYGKIPL